LAQAIELEAETFLEAMKDLKLADGRDRLVRHGHGPERAVQTGIAPVEVSRVKIRDRGAASDGERIRFTSAILPLCARRTRSLDSLPVLYLRGISTEDFQEVLSALLGTDAPNLSPRRLVASSPKIRHSSLREQVLLSKNAEKTETWPCER
jgi:putative transposase